MLDKIRWLGHSSLFVEGLTAKIYFDPFKIKQGLIQADIILITHAHFDHCSAVDIKKVYQPQTRIIGPQAITRGLPFKVSAIKPGEKVSVKGVEIEAVYAYNIGKTYHPKSDDNLGYLVSVDNTRIYHAGDTDLIPEMRQIKADIAFLPVGGTYTMDVKEAAEAARIINPGLAVPIHWGSPNDGQEFKEICHIKVKILDKEG